MMTDYLSGAFAACSGSLRDHQEWSFVLHDCCNVWVALGVALISILLTLRIRKTGSRKSRNKNLPPLPPLGPSFPEYLAVQMEGRLTDSQETWIQAYGRLFTVPSPLPGLVPTTCVCADPAIVKELCIDQTNQYRPPSRFTTRPASFAAAVRDSVGTSLAASTGDEWKWRRTAFVKELHKSKLLDPNRHLLDTIFQVGEQLCAKLEKAAVNEQVVPVDILTTEAAFDTILFFMFGKVLTGYHADQIRQAAKDILAYMFMSLTTGPLFFILKHIPGTRAYQATQTRNAAWKVFNDLVQDEIIQMIQEAKTKVPIDKDRRAPGSILASWLSTQPKFYERGLGPISAEVRGMLIAGFETTAHALAYSFGMMAENPELSQQLHLTAKKTLQCCEDRQAALDESEFCKHFFLEALRLYPLAPALNGECTDDIVLHWQGKEYGLPKGTQCAFLNYSMQRHPQYCKGSKGPNEIEPDRWNVPKQQTPFLHTFNTGPHTCPGKPLSLLEGHIFLLQVASQFDFAFPDGTESVLYEEQLLLRPKDAMPLRVIKR